MERGCGLTWIDWRQPAVKTVYRAALAYARLAYRLAEQTGVADADNAWVAGLLAPLGWLAIAAVEPSQIEACLQHPRFSNQPAATQQLCWGLDQAAIARRLARQWRLPLWLAAVAGHLGLVEDVARPLGTDPELFHIIQLTVGLLQQKEVGLRLAVGTEPTPLADALGLRIGDLEALVREAAVLADHEAATRIWGAPADKPLLIDLLHLAVENRRLRQTATRERMERDIDFLHGALAGQHAGEVERLKTQKLTALAEFAAGAGHEINNPLAVISGQAQYLLNRCAEPGHERAEDDHHPDRSAFTRSCVN